MITVPDNTFANRRSDNEIGIAISLIMLIGAQSGSHGGSGEHIPVHISFRLWCFALLKRIMKNVISASASAMPLSQLFEVLFDSSVVVKYPIF